MSFCMHGASSMQICRSAVRSRGFLQAGTVEHASQKSRCAVRTLAVSAPSAPPSDSRTVARGSIKVPGKTVVITGGSQGIGRAAAHRFAKEGYNVVIAARDPALVAATAEELVPAASSSGRQGAALGVPTDITNERDVQRLVERVANEYASVDVLINCAGVCVTGLLMDTPLDVFRAQLNVNFLGAVSMTQGFQPALVEAAQRGAKPVVAMVNSFAGRIPLKSMPAYTASKFALAGFTDAIRPEFADLGIHVAQINPGVVRSKFMDRAGFLGEKGQENRERMEQMLASGAGGVVQESEQVADVMWRAVRDRKNEVTVGVPFQLINAAYKTFNVNPFSLA